MDFSSLSALGIFLGFLQCPQPRNNSSLSPNLSFETIQSFALDDIMG